MCNFLKGTGKHCFHFTDSENVKAFQITWFLMSQIWINGYTISSFKFAGNPLHRTVFARLQLSCQKSIEFPYFTSWLGRKDKCCHCAMDKAKRVKDLLKKFKVVLPICTDTECKEKGLPIMKRNPFKWEPFYIINIIYI